MWKTIKNVEGTDWIILLFVTTIVGAMSFVAYSFVTIPAHRRIDDKVEIFNNIASVTTTGSFYNFTYEDKETKQLKWVTASTRVADVFFDVPEKEETWAKMTTKYVNNNPKRIASKVFEIHLHNKNEITFR